jgi:hypothetical protein
MNPSGNPALAQYRFKKGQSGNPRGAPKGVRHFSALRIVAEALDTATQEKVVEAFRQELKKPGRVLACLEFAAKLNHELPPPRAELDLEGEGELRIKLTWGDGL